MSDIERTIEALNANNIECVLAKSREEALEMALALIPADAEVGLGGSVSVEEIGLLQKLRDGDYTLHDQYEIGIDMEENMARRRKGMVAPFFVTGTNAITMDGQLVNLDGMGNRVAAQMFGPTKVVLIAGTNKIVKDVHEAFDRLQNVAAPTNAKRVGMGTPCQDTGECIDCDSPMRICNMYTIIRRMMFPGRVTLILVDEKLGF